MWLRRSRTNGDRGVAIILFALLLTALFVIVALVIDFGFVRNTRQDTKATADAATSAGLLSLAHEGHPKPWTGACAALAYLRANESSRTLTVSYMDGNEDAVSDPCITTALLERHCSSSKLTWAKIVVTDGQGFTAEIRTPYVTPDPDFAEDSAAYLNDDGKPGANGCDQLAVIVFDEDFAYFGGIVGRESYATATRTVGRANIKEPNDGTPAFVILERVDCGALVNQASGNTVDNGGEWDVVAGIVVEPASATEGGAIHVDSSGKGACSGGEVPGGRTVFSGEVGSSPKLPGIRVLGPGARLSLRALSDEGQANRAYGTSTGVSPAGTEGAVVSRRVVDKKYSASDGTRTLSIVHQRAKQRLAASAAASYTDTTTDPPTVYTPVTTCTGHVGPVLATHVYVDCPSGYTAEAATFANAVDVVFSGPVTVPSGTTLFLPAARHVTIGGDVANNDAGKGLTVQGGTPGGRFGINSSAFATTDVSAAAACDSRAALPSQMVIFGGRTNGNVGALDVTGRAALCHTMVYLAGDKGEPQFSVQERADGAPDDSCVPETPCPKSTGNLITSAYLTVSGYLRWTAPNQTSAELPEGSVGIEDLALWTESATTSNVSGTLDAQGLYFLPNSLFQMQSPSTFSPRDAQFIARKLHLLQGLLRMKPTPANSVQVPFLPGINLVR